MAQRRSGPGRRSTPGDPLTLDFSRVEFADFGALARALLLLDAAVKSGIPATVVLPDTTVITASEPGDPGAAQAARQARTRGDTLAYMRQVGFVDSLRAPHWKPGAVRILDRSLTTPAGHRRRDAGVRPGLGSRALPAAARVSVALARAHARRSATGVRFVPGGFGWPGGPRAVAVGRADPEPDRADRTGGERRRARPCG